MAKTRFFQSTFVSGALSPLLKGRIDLEQYYQGVETAKNLVIVPQGGLKRRAGTEFVEKVLNVIERKTGLTPTMPEGGTPATIADGDDSTTTSTTSTIDSAAPYVIGQYDLGTPEKLEFVDVRRISVSTGTISSLIIQSSDDNVTWTTAGTLPLTGINPQDFRVTVSSTARYWRLCTLTDANTGTVTLAGLDLMYETAETSAVKLIDFSISTDRVYICALTSGNIRIFKTPAIPVIDIRSPLTNAIVPTVRSAQSEAVLLLFQQDLEPQRVINLGTDTDWTTDVVPFTNVPQYDYDDFQSPVPVNEIQVMTLNSFVSGDTFQIDIEGILSKNITFAGGTAGDQANSTRFNLQKNLQEMPVFGETGVAVTGSGSVFTITISGESTKDFELFSGFATSGTASKTVTFTKTQSGSPRKENVWSATRGWPKTACFFEGRLWLGGTKSKLQSVFASKTGSFFNYDIDDGDDDEGIFATISARKMNEIIDIFPGRNLQIFTTGSEFSIKNQPITPTNIAIAVQTSHGASNIRAEEIDGSTLFVDRNGKSLREFLYSFNEDAYTTLDKSVLSSHLINQPVDMTLLSGTQSEDSNWVFLANTAGDVTILNTLRSQDINGFTQMITGGKVRSMTSVDYELFMIVEREIDSQTVSYIERWDFNYLMDSSTLIAPAPTQTVLTGLDHLEGELVQIVGDGIVLTPKTVTGGQIELEANEIGYAEIEVGLNFPIELVPMPLNTNIGSGSNQMRLKRVLRINMRVLDSYGVYVDENPVPIRTFGSAPTTPLNNPPTALTGIIDDIYDINGWNRDTMPTISVPDPTPFHIQAIEYEVESS